jgi:sortase A
MRAHVLLRRVEYTLWIAGALVSGFCAGEFLEARIYQAVQNRRLEEALRSQRPQPPTTTPTPRREPRPLGSLVGRLEIPRLGFSAIVLEGSDSGTLRVGVGRIPQTADPGDKGNIVLSGHRDTFFRPLRGIRDGDKISLVTATGKYRYVVDWTTVVDPSNTSSLQPTPVPSLTLVTCYPFHYVGPAPQRFVVRARQVEPGPAASVKVASYQPPAARQDQVSTSTQPASRRRTQKQKMFRGGSMALNTRRDQNLSARWR